MGEVYNAFKSGDIDLIVAKKADSQEICFIPDDDYVKFLKEKAEKLDEAIIELCIVYNLIYNLLFI